MIAEGKIGRTGSEMRPFSTASADNEILIQPNDQYFFIIAEKP
jgi:hypothetical protein